MKTIAEAEEKINMLVKAVVSLQEQVRTSYSMIGDLKEEVSRLYRILEVAHKIELPRGKQV